MEREAYVGDAAVGADYDDDYDDESSSDDDGTFPPDRYLDRELSWLSFNQRVLELAEDQHVPLLERVNYAAIVANNLDEFFMVRVAGLKRRIATGLAVPTNVGRNPSDVLNDISRAAHEQQERHALVFANDIKPKLDDEGIHIETLADLAPADRAQIDEIFSAQ
ncbi:MAG TPA: RNA degradosome polyphosphate kinase, partial [Galbitalea sp.]|nr:RNA degradosome polyphosphate kinase [Galbitalea sp.]